jgi:hypothetical protein
MNGIAPSASRSMTTAKQAMTTQRARRGRSMDVFEPTSRARRNTRVPAVNVPSACHATAVFVARKRMRTPPQHNTIARGPSIDGNHSVSSRLRSSTADASASTASMSSFGRANCWELTAGPDIRQKSTKANPSRSIKAAGSPIRMPLVDWGLSSRASRSLATDERRECRAERKNARD